MRNIKLTIEYDGTNYNGWQIQRNGTTIQGKIESAISSITSQEVKLNGASRTDSGVHAMGQVANFLTDSKIPVKNIVKALNSILPRDIVIKNSEEVPLDFHSRFSSVGKRYKYTIYNGVTPIAIGKDFSYYYPKRLNYDAMCRACQYFIGTHDFTAFKSVGSSAKTSQRTINMSSILINNNCVEYHIGGDGFLYNMVRIITGTLIEVGQNKIKPENIPQIIESKNRKLAGKTLPPQGLCLMEVFY